VSECYKLGDGGHREGRRAAPDGWVLKTNAVGSGRADRVKQPGRVEGGWTTRRGDERDGNSSPLMEGGEGGGGGNTTFDISLGSIFANLSASDFF
jgi:hypothetical protein